MQGPRRRILCDRSGQEAERGVGAEGPQPFLQAGGAVRPLQEEQRRCQRRRLSGMRRHLSAGECILMRRHLFAGECILMSRHLFAGGCILAVTVTAMAINATL